MALACAKLGLRFCAVMPEGVSNERVLIIKAYGGRVVCTPRELGIRGAIAEAEKMEKQAGAFLPRQFSNEENVNAHRYGTAREITHQIPGGSIDAIVSGVGTGGTLMGIFRGLRESGCEPVPVMARPVNLKRGLDAESCSFSDQIPGVVDKISTLFREKDLPGLLTVEVEDKLAIETARDLMTQGFPVGPSSGLNFRAAVMAAEKLGESARIVTLFPDRMERYFTTDLFRPFLAEPSELAGTRQP